MTSESLLPWIVAAPLAGAGLLFTWRGIPDRAVPWIGAGSVALAALITALLSIAWLPSPEPVTRVLWTWFSVEGWAPRIALHLDGLALTMLWVITGVGSLIHVFAGWYLHGDAGIRRFFAYMNLFVASMLLLVLADDLLALYFGWEGVGLCSYLLIGYYRDDPANGHAARKAFVITRVGDTLMALGLFLLVREFGTLGIAEIVATAPERFGSGDPVIALIALLLLGGAAGKSAQIPLHTWLPDAMAGPTPVSALIHAATMVTAGVYLIARLHPLFELAPVVLQVVGWIGAIGLLMAGITALAQRDIKRILAYSTMSQIAYMFVALGAGAYTAAVFHLMTHAFFKALLFLAAGAVIHALHHEQDIFRMGGLRRRLPLAYASFVAGSGALAALPFVTAGFYSKDAILFAAWGGGHYGWWTFGALCALLTGVYAFRLVFIVFHGPERRHGHQAPHEDRSLRMRLPLLALIGLSLFGALVPLTAALSLPDVHVEHPLPVLLAQVALSLGGIGIAWLLYGRGRETPEPLRGWRRIAAAAFGFDALFDHLVVNPWLALCRLLRRDPADGLFAAGIAALARGLHHGALLPQTGQLRSYAVAIALGLILLLGAALW
ncbi:NADH-quinone oxidoreductase subunit L [Sinimarinibacterium flocculans]|uniref:NADH dehydrogenase subunit L n=1 Tax=Sinimarinibacterium flocculans TaxID=985250 RepID=A0A318ED01_9GAMM|nr:NADH-quinone oxidoreductase subunit L [Sinimarinibacterium flocculans]PXV65641.1 NADH dehydrogenase subunit L [Sinimarinibacterium flocculans]